jgi:hypothetical protein
MPACQPGFTVDSVLRGGTSRLRGCRYDCLNKFRTSSWRTRELEYISDIYFPPSRGSFGGYSTKATPVTWAVHHPRI